MEPNQTALQIAKEYERMAMKSIDQHYRLVQTHPFSEFSALKKHVGFCTDMSAFWSDVSRQLIGDYDDSRGFFGEQSL